MRNQVNTKKYIGDSDHQFPEQAASSMSVKGKDEVDDTGQDDEPGNNRVDCDGGKSRRTNREHSKDNEQNATQDGPCRSLTYDVGRSLLRHKPSLNQRTECTPVVAKCGIVGSGYTNVSDFCPP